MIIDFQLDPNKYLIQKSEVVLRGFSSYLNKQSAQEESFKITIYINGAHFDFPTFVLRDENTQESLQELILSCDWLPADGLPRPLSQRWVNEQLTLITPELCETTSFALGTLNHLANGDVKLKITLRDGREHVAKISLLLHTRAKMTQATPPLRPPSFSLLSQTPSSSPKPKTQAMNSKGWLAFDFGTSNSTVTIYDSTVRTPSQVISIESFTILQQELIKLFDDTLQAHSDLISSEWGRLTREIKESISPREPISSTLQQATYANPKALFNIIYFLEVKVFTYSPDLRKIIYARLQEIYTKMSSAPSLTARRAFVAYLNPADKHASAISSDVQIINVEPLSIEIGPRVRDARQQALNANKSIEGEFHSSIKSFLFSPLASDDLMINDESGSEAHISRADLLKETLSTLKMKSEHWNASREGHVDNPYAFDELVITYPTIAPPSARAKLKKIAEDVGFKHVYMDYDEATAAALFYIIKDYDPSSKRGLSALKSKSHKHGESFYQHLVILDIGGGTTDVARLKLSLHEENPFKAGEDRGAGGTYHVLTPQLEASTGELQLGGDLLTLKTFQLIKVLICDSLLTHKSSLDESMTLISAFESLPARFKDKDEYRARSLVEAMIKSSDEGAKEIRDHLNMLLPTNWKGKAQEPQRACRNLFYQLWDLADQAKRKLGQKAPYFEISGHLLSGLFLSLEEELELSWPHDRNLQVLLSDFENIIAPYVQEAVNLAISLINDEVNKLILSGQTCYLQQVRDLIDVELSQRNYIERCFDPTYSKLSTSVGACVTHQLTQKRLNPQGAKEHMKRGDDFVEVNVKNLLFNLPCSFKIDLQSGSLDTLFKDREELKLLEPVSQEGREVGALRSLWLRIAPRTEILRVKESNKSSGHLQWGVLTLNNYREATGYTEHQLADMHLVAQFEVNQHLELFAYLTKRRTSQDENIQEGSWSYRADSPFETIKLYDLLPPNKITLEAQERIAEGRPAVQVKANWGHSGNTHTAKNLVTDEMLFSAFIVDPNLPESDHPALKVKISSDDFDAQNAIEISVAWAGSDEFYQIHTFRRSPLAQDSFPMDYHFTLDSKGHFSLHEGEVPYLLVDDINEIFTRPGSVYKESLPSDMNNTFSENRDPFSGIH